VGDVPPLQDVWLATQPGAAHPPSFCLFDQTYGPPHCCDYVFATPDLVARTRRIAYDIETGVSDHQPVLVEIADD
jgi:endonuclease/exonuclease/phosphatase family metal-dependent hydrolase